MFLSNEEMFVLRQISANLCTGGVIPNDDIVRFSELVEKLEKQKKDRNDRAKNYIRNKRKEDKTYAQPYATKNKILGL